MSRQKNNISLRDGDIIRVNKNFFGKSTDSLGTFLPPIRDIYSLYGVYKLLNSLYLNHVLIYRKNLVILRKFGAKLFLLASLALNIAGAKAYIFTYTLIHQ